MRAPDRDESHASRGGDTRGITKRTASEARDSARARSLTSTQHNWISGELGGGRNGRRAAQGDRKSAKTKQPQVSVCRHRACSPSVMRTRRRWAEVVVLVSAGVMAAPACGGDVAADERGESDLTKAQACGGDSGNPGCAGGGVCIDDLQAACNHFDADFNVDPKCAGVCVIPEKTQPCLQSEGCGEGSGLTCVFDPRDRSKECRQFGSCRGFCVPRRPGTGAPPPARDGAKCGGKLGIRCESGLHCVKPASPCPDCMGTCTRGT